MTRPHSFLEDLDAEAKLLLSGLLERRFVSAGTALIRQGERSDALYIVDHGRLRAILDDAHGRHVVGEIANGETAGEISLLTGAAARASVIAARDTWVWRLTHESFDAVTKRSASVALAVARLMARRARAENTGRFVAPATIAIVPCGVESGALSAFVRAFALALRKSSPLVVDRAVAENLFDTTVSIGANAGDQGPLDRRLDELQTRHSLIVYVADRDSSEWTRCCIARADHILRIVGDDPALSQLERELAHAGRLGHAADEDLVRLYGDERPPRDTARFFADRAVDGHHHVRLRVARDVERVARRVHGRPVGIALSGGGTRGAAHLALLTALEEAGVTVDLIAGSSIGSFFGAQYALGHAPGLILERLEETIRGGVFDFTLPLVSLLAGYRYRRMMQRAFGDARIEDLATPCYLVSSDLTSTESVVHDEGPLWLAARASGSPPGIVPPVRLGDRLLVDGGVLNNLPTDVVRRRASNALVIGSDVSAPDTAQWASFSDDAMSGWRILARRLLRKPTPPGIADVILRASTLASARHQSVVGAAGSDLYFRPPLEGVGGFDTKSLRRIYDDGLVLAREAVAQWSAAGAFEENATS